MKIYNYSKETGEFLSASDAFTDPLEQKRTGKDVFLVPAYATKNAPPVAGANEVAVYELENWVIKPDHRGETWFKGYNVPVLIKDIGDPASDGLTAIEPSPPSATIAEVKAEAGRRINKHFPDYAQRNHIARQSELGRIESGIMRDNSGNLIAARTLTTEEIEELAFIKGAWDWISSVRAASSVIAFSPPKIDELETDDRWPADPS